MNNRQCPMCASFKIGGEGPLGMGPWGWLVHLVLLIITGGIWIFIYLIGALCLKFLEDPDVTTSSLVCGGCGYRWTETSPTWRAGIR